jgi:hypothetical protein
MHALRVIKSVLSTLPPAAAESWSAPWGKGFIPWIGSVTPAFFLSDHLLSSFSPVVQSKLKLPGAVSPWGFRVAFFLLRAVRPQPVLFVTEEPLIT